ncbi:regulatory protein RecX [Hydrogenothermus marinus]|uniref:regulatory protein RecX n=1 Tax=Hydrogenothermus marinus TaxID=133270 RepID=UPI000EF98500
MSKDIKSYAFKLLSKKDYFSKELENKLRQKGYSEKEISEIIDYLEKEDYINDKKLLKRYKQLAIEKGESPLKLKSKLYRKGVNVEFTYEEEYKSAINRIKKYTGSKDYKSIVKYLINRGFSYSISTEIAKKYLRGEI